MPTTRKTSSQRRYLQGLKAATSGNAQAFGFSILITVSYGIASSSVVQPTLGEQIGFAMSAVAAFSLLNMLVAALDKGESDTLGSKRVLLVATATDFIAVGAGLAVAAGINIVLTGLIAWLLIPFCAGLAYMLVQAFELAVGRMDVEQSRNR